MKRHINLFEYYDSKSQVYEKLQADYVRDQKYSDWCIYALMALVALCNYFKDPELRYFLFAGIATAALRYVFLFVDNSNRNFLLHSIDWFERKENERLVGARVAGEPAGRADQVPNETEVAQNAGEREYLVGEPIAAQPFEAGVGPRVERGNAHARASGRNRAGASTAARPGSMISQSGSGFRWKRMGSTPSVDSSAIGSGTFRKPGPPSNWRAACGSRCSARPGAGWSLC